MKPARWISRLETPCKDQFHWWLMKHWGFEKYCKERGWEKTPDDMKYDDEQEWLGWCRFTLGLSPSTSTFGTAMPSKIPDEEAARIRPGPVKFKVSFTEKCDPKEYKGPITDELYRNGERQMHEQTDELILEEMEADVGKPIRLDGKCDDHGEQVPCKKCFDNLMDELGVQKTPDAGDP